MQHVAADLVAPAGRDVLALELRLLLGLPLQLAARAAGLEDLHRRLAVAVLRALVLAGDDDAGRQVRDADRGGVLLDVLAAVAAGAEDVDPQVVGVDLDSSAASSISGMHLDERERRVPRVRGVEGREAHQAVDAALASQVAVGVAAADLDGRALDAGLFARR